MSTIFVVVWGSASAGASGTWQWLAALAPGQLLVLARDLFRIACLRRIVPIRVPVDGAQLPQLLVHPQVQVGLSLEPEAFS